MTRRGLIKNPAVVCTDMDDGAVLLDLETTAYYSLNRTALGIWKLIDNEPTVEGIAARVTEKYQVDHEQALASVGRLLATLEHEKLVRTEPS
jgi:Coenzyme PQQ synthesis protein D (PqqD)